MMDDLSSIILHQWRLLHMKDLTHGITRCRYYETADEIEQAFALLRPGGILLGDDFTGVWPGVMRAVSEFVQAQPTGSISHPHEYACSWPFYGRLEQARVPRGGALPLLKKETQWILRKSATGVPREHERRRTLPLVLNAAAHKRLRFVPLGCP